MVSPGHPSSVSLHAVASWSIMGVSGREPRELGGGQNEPSMSRCGVDSDRGRGANRHCSLLLSRPAHYARRGVPRISRVSGTTATLTPLQRPEELGDKAFLTEEEAANLAQETVDRNERLLNRAPERTVAADNVDSRADGTPGFYNNFWLDRGTTAIGTRRTSLIVDPSDGRLPPLTATAQRRSDSAEAERIAAVRRGELPADSWEDLDAGDRCIQHAKAGPPISTGGYNNNVQLFQTPDYVVLLNEQNHDARIIPLDGRPHVGPEIRQWMGDSRGHWDGDTLVIETIPLQRETRPDRAASAEYRRAPVSG